MWRATEVQEAMRRGHQGGGRWLPLGTDMAQELFQGAVREHCRLSCVAGACKLLATCTQRSCWLTCVGLQLVKLAQDGGGGGGGQYMLRAGIHAAGRTTAKRSRQLGFISKGKLGATYFWRTSFDCENLHLLTDAPASKFLQQ